MNQEKNLRTRQKITETEKKHMNQRTYEPKIQEPVKNQYLLALRIQII